MSLFSEQLVEEYYNRRRFLTIRGARQGVGEIDLLAIRHHQIAVEGLHIEIQTSFRPVAYLSNSNARVRSDEQTQEDMKVWIQKKYLSTKKEMLRQSVWSGIKWRFVLVHARLKDERELVILKQAGIELLPFEDVICEITLPTKKGEFTATAGGDASEILRYQIDVYKRNEPLS